MNEIKIPELAESITEGTIAEWLVKEGSFIEKDTPVIELETDKVNVEVTSDYAGVLTEITKKAGTDVQVGDAIAQINTKANKADKKKGTNENAETDQSVKPSNNDIKRVTDPLPMNESSKQHAPKSDVANKEVFKRQLNDFIKTTPSARKHARELGVDLESIDLDELLLNSEEKSSEYDATSEVKQEYLDKNLSNQRPEERQKMSRRRMTIATRLVEAQQSSAMLTTFNEVDLTSVIQLRKERQEAFQKTHDVKLGFMSFFTKAVVAALKHFPLLNAEIDGQELILKKYYDIGIAVSADEGLVVPVVKDADKQNFASIEKEIKQLGLKARDNKLTLEDLEGGTFTITNGGVFGSLLSTPILNTPQVGILGMHTIQQRPIAMPDDRIEIRPMMYIALSYDHRIVDGKEAVQFLIKIKELLEDPYNLLLEG